MNNVPDPGTEINPSLDLTIKPYGVEVFSDLERGKSFVVLFYRHDGGPRGRVLAWIGEVLDDLTRAGIHISDAVKPVLTADQSRSEVLTPKTRYRCHLQVPVMPLSDVEAGRQAFVEAIRARYSKH